MRKLIVLFFIGLAGAQTRVDLSNQVKGQLPFTNIAPDPASTCLLTTAGGSTAWGACSGGVSSVFTRTGAVTAQTGDYTAAQVTNALDVSQTRGAWTFFGNGTNASATPLFFSFNVNAQTGAGYTLVTGDFGKLVSVSNASAQTASLPSTVPVAGWYVDINNTGAGTWTVSPNGHNLDGGAGSMTLTTNQGVRVFTDGTNYFTQRGVGGGGGGTVSSVFTRTGAVVAQSGDYTAAQVTNAFDTSVTRSAWTFFGNASNASATPTFSAFGVNAQTGAGYTVVNGDFAKLVSVSNATAQTINLPSTVPTAGWYLDIQNTGAGTWTLSPNGHNLDGAAGSISIFTGQGTRIFTDGTNYFTQRGNATGVTSVFGRTGVVVATSGDYTAAQVTNAVQLNAVNTFTAAGTLDLSGSTVANAFKVNVAAGATAGADGAIAYDSTNKNTHVRANAADAIVGAFASAPTTGDCVKATVASGNVLLADAGAPCGTVTGSNLTGGQVIIGGGNSSISALAGPTAPNNVAQVLTSTPSGGVAGNAVWNLAGVAINPQTGTTYTVAATDRQTYISFNNAAAIAVTLPQAGSGGGGNNDFTHNFTFVTCDIGAGTATITPTTSTISFSNGSTYTAGATALSLTTGQCAFVYSDNTNYFAIVRSGGGGSALSAITAATGSNTIANGNNPQIWNWAQTTDAQDAFTFGETSAATNGTLTNALANQALLHLSTASGSTETPIEVEQAGVTGITGPPLLQLESTWNNASLVGEGILLNVTNTSSAAGSKLLDLRVGNTAEFTADKAGNAIATTSLQTTTSAPACTAGSAGALCQAEGTAFTNVASTAGFYPDSTQHEYLAATNGSTSFGMITRRQPSPVHQTGQTAAITTATLCAASAGACNVAGQYHVHFDFIETGTACATPGPGAVTFLLSWTDTNGTAHAAVALQMVNQTGAATTAMGSSFTFATALANAGAGGDFNISTNGTVIQYATGYTACTTGTGTYQLDASVTRLQ